MGIIVSSKEGQSYQRPKYYKEVREIATKRYKDLTPAQKAKRLAYAKTRRLKIEAAARAAGVIGAARPKMSPVEAKAKRKVYAKAYRQRIQAEAAAYRRMTEGKKK